MTLLVIKSNLVGYMAMFFMQLKESMEGCLIQIAKLLFHPLGLKQRVNPCRYLPGLFPTLETCYPS
jgi:hypothetical protein